MQKFITLLAVLAIGIKAYCQDIIILRNGDELKAKVTEITETTIKYHKWDNLTGPVYNIAKAEVFKVKYENGQSDFFGNVPSSVQPQTTEPVKQSNKGKDMPTQVVIVEDVKKSYPTPPTVNTPYYYDEQRGKLTLLEEVKFDTAKVRSGWWGKHNIITLQGTYSNVQVSKKWNPVFIVKFDNPAIEPYKNMVLNTAEINDDLKRREWVAVTQGAHGIQEQQDEVRISFNRIGVGTYLITLDDKLKPGELFFMIKGSDTVYAFGYSK